jgi:hypothetical protein
LNFIEDMEQSGRMGLGVERTQHRLALHGVYHTAAADSLMMGIEGRPI